MTDWKNHLQPGSHRRILLDSLPLNTFVDLSRLESFSGKHISLLVMSVKNMPNMAISFKPIGDLPFGSLEVVTCGDLATGYLLSAPTCKNFIGRNYASLKRRDINTDIQRIFVDGRLVIMGNDSLLVVTIPSKRWIFP